MCFLFFFFFFQAEDGIRDLYVTGVQTCALPIWKGGCRRGEFFVGWGKFTRQPKAFIKIRRNLRRQTRHCRCTASCRLIWSRQDRKSTRLNSSHVEISYAVFCLKKKSTQTECK